MNTVKLFHKDKAIKLIFVGADRRVRTKWVLPKGNQVTIGDYTYILTEEKMFINEGIPTYFVNYKSAEVLNPLAMEDEMFNPSMFKNAIDSKVERELFAATKPKETINMQTMIMFGIVVVVIYTFIMLKKEISGLEDTLKLITETLGGVDNG